MSSRPVSLAIALCWASGVSQSVARAEPAPAAIQVDVRDHTQEEARKQHRAGVEAYAAGNYPQAISAFLTADALHSSPATTFNIAKTYELMGDPSHALEYYRAYIRRSPSAADRQAVAQRIAKLSGRVAERGVQQASFIVTPAGSSVFVDAEPIGAAPITLDLSPGTHVVEFRKAGYAPARFEFELPSDRPVDVIATLARGAHAEPARASAIAAVPGSTRAVEAKALPSADDAQAAARVAPAAPRGGSRGSTVRTIGFVALGASVAAIGGAITFEVMRSSAEAEARRESDQVGYSEAVERMKSRQTMARVFAGTGGALAALGGVMLVVASGGGAAERQKKEGGLALGCLPSKCHASFTGAF